jgi:hypothetical protein
MASATTFSGVVELIRKAEDALIKKANMTGPDDRVCAFRGIYYGTPWSLDYQVEAKRSEAGARIRNLGFLTYTGGNVPADPRPALGSALFDDLQGSQSIADRGRGCDIGHLLIGLETRNSFAMRNVPLPGQGGTGIEIVTWLGDLGGGAASLALKRVKVPSTSVQVIFENRTSDYGVMENLEGDAAGYLVACDKSPGGAPVWPSGKGVADMIQAYLPIGSTEQWSTRAARFVTALGGTISDTNISNARTLVAILADKLYDFAVWYAATRWIPSGQLLGKNAEQACKHMKNAAIEVAVVFVQTLNRAISAPTAAIKASAPYPKPSPVSAKCESTLLDAASADPGAVRKQLGSWHTELGGLFK